MIDPTHRVDAGAAGDQRTASFAEQEEALLQLVAEGRPIKAIAAARNITPAAAADEVDKLFLRIGASRRRPAAAALKRLRMLHDAIVSSEEQGETLSRACCRAGSPRR